MKCRISWLLAVPLLLVLLAGSPGAERPAAPGAAGTRYPWSTLHLSGGDYLAGELCDCDQADHLLWQGSAFVAPLDFPLAAVSAVSFPRRSPVRSEPQPRPDGPYCLELDGGDVLFGALAGLSSQAGPVRLARPWPPARPALRRPAHLCTIAGQPI